ncbi:MAG TPA: hypothetical protein P5262_04060 [Candidatus Moranbacteria bacterium]|nr:hypothetical protein [Candidatus Moranbacteria bacterium]
MRSITEHLGAINDANSSLKAIEALLAMASNRSLRQEEIEKADSEIKTISNILFQLA